MSLLATHLEQISLSCQGIDSLPFPPPKIFTNALLSSHDITSLIRDTEAHERALFSVPPPPPPPTHQAQAEQFENVRSSSRRQTVFNVTGGEVTTGPPKSRSAGNPRRNTAVAAVLGGEMHASIMKRVPLSQREAGGDVELDMLLKGAEKLCHVYPLPGALERIPAIKQRWSSQAATLSYYEGKVAEQSERLGRMNKMDIDSDQPQDYQGHDFVLDSLMTEEDLRREEEEVKDLEKKKRELQQRLRAMDKDLGGLLNM
ncbi:DASH complex subunit Spc34 [Coniella lustricola]|uniref:DASH complex subunit SPC34 n=1 Tax=Coniella lustricola TaxID=2025994 RepID=A0A2T3A1D0_9PEZI|nr:DASH complex subunit Spc34 [Coniella lustricola]